MLSGEASYMAGDPTRRKESIANDGCAVVQDVDSADESTDTEEAVRYDAGLWVVQHNLQKITVDLSLLTLQR